MTTCLLPSSSAVGGDEEGGARPGDGRGLADAKLELRPKPAEDCVYVFSGRSQGRGHWHHMLVITAA